MASASSDIEPDADDEGAELGEGALDPDEVDPDLEPWDEGADDEL